MMSLRALAIIFVSIAFFATPAFAQQAGAPKALGVFGTWSAYTYSEKGQPVCYMVAKAHTVPNKKLKRSAAWLTITHRPGENSTDVVSYTSGYNFKAASDVEVHIGKDNFGLFTQKDTAWSRDSMTDHALAADIRKNPSMTLTGVPDAHGAGNATDTLDLKGAAAAYNAIGKACGMKVDESPKPAAANKKNAIKH